MSSAAAGRSVQDRVVSAGRWRVGLTGWLEDVDETSVAHLLVYPATAGVEHRMGLLAEVMGLVARDGGEHRLVAVEPDTTHVRLAAGRVSVHYGRAGVIGREAPASWRAAAAARRSVVLSVGEHPWDGRQGSLPPYLDQPCGIAAGAVRVLGG